MVPFMASSTLARVQAGDIDVSHILDETAGEKCKKKRPLADVFGKIYLTLITL
jgi:hypothetical protein